MTATTAAVNDGPYRAWRIALQQRLLKDTASAIAAEQDAYDAAIEYVELHDLIGSAIDPRGPLPDENSEH